MFQIVWDDKQPALQTVMLKSGVEEKKVIKKMQYMDPYYNSREEKHRKLFIMENSTVWWDKKKIVERINFIRTMCGSALLTKDETEDLGRQGVLHMLCKLLAVPDPESPDEVDIKVIFEKLDEKKAKVFQEFMNDKWLATEAQGVEFHNEMEKLNTAKALRDISEEAAEGLKGKKRKKKKGAVDEVDDGEATPVVLDDATQW